ncbi:transposase, IS605 OrfB family [Ktedonobacter racemifer DSM 44963]|uniref:Transposase, IS605 OrfB family n=1 Tax=Ktedonobacter racemifer DSM 44963 TaxID=485913 RepID=D6TY86_KTERA|nr:transposase, IS605 OrfB family [Ktedonobacter racemifer DSM 44963]
MIRGIISIFSVLFCSCLGSLRRHTGFSEKRLKCYHSKAGAVEPLLNYCVEGADEYVVVDMTAGADTFAGCVARSEKNKMSRERLKSPFSPVCLEWRPKPSKKKEFYLLVTLEVETSDPTPETHKQIVGVDVGMRYLAVTATMQGDCTFHADISPIAKSHHYARLRKRLQKKGTRSATRRLVAISGRERRLKANVNHVVSKRIVLEHPQSLIGLEHLTDIRERTKRRKGKKASAKQRKANRTFSKWAFGELHAMIAYKALLHRSMAIKVDANSTSQACPKCGHTCKENRPHKGLLFVCQNCQYTLHADLVGARNIAMRTLLIRQDWIGTGLLSVRPDVSDDEAKVARLKRYAELRWSSDTSPRL